MYWLLRSIPELSSFTPADRARLLALTVPLRARIHMAVRVFVSGIFAGLVGTWFARGAGFVDPALLWTACGLSACVVASTVHLLQIAGIRRNLRDAIRRAAADAPPPICMSCGHDLTHSSDAVCSECGAVRTRTTSH